MIVRARFREQHPVPAAVTSPEARALALAYAIELAVESGQFGSMSELALALGLSRSRLSQVTSARWAPVAVQERALGTRGAKVSHEHH